MTIYTATYTESRTRTVVVDAPDSATAIHAAHRSIIDGYDAHGILSDFNATIRASSDKPSIMVSRSILGYADAMRLVDKIVGI